MTSTGWPSPRGALSRAGMVASMAVRFGDRSEPGDKEEERRSVAPGRSAVGAGRTDSHAASLT